MYKGVLPNHDKDDGTFYCTLDEFLETFDVIDIAEVKAGAVVSAVALSTAKQSMVALEFKMASDKPFAVQLEWPNSRFLKACEGGTLDPTFTVLVAKKDSLTAKRQMPPTKSQMSNARLNMPGGSGVYVVFVSVDFPKGQWLEEYVVNVYGPPTELKISAEDPMDLSLKMDGLCESVTLPGFGDAVFKVDKGTKINGYPVFGPANTVWGPMYMYRARDGSGWQIYKSLAGARRGTYYPSDSDAWKTAKCVAALLEAEVPTRAARVLADLEKPHEHRDELKGEVLTKNGMPVDAAALLEGNYQVDGCKEDIARLRDLANGVSGSSDPEFP